MVSNFSLVMGIAGATSGQTGVLLAGLAGLLAGALSMPLGEWISVKSSLELYENQMQLEMDELETNPEGEEKELALIYISKGIPEEQAKTMAKDVMLNKDQAHEILIKEELGINPEDLKGSAMEAAITSFILFAIGAVIPVIPFFFLAGIKAIILSTARLIFESAYVSKVERIESIQFHTAEERYNALMKESPNLLQRVSLKHIASYLGTFLGKLDLEITDGKYTGMQYQLMDVDPAKYPEDIGMKKLVEKIYEPYKKELQTVIGTSTTPLVRYFVMETPMDNLITDAIKWKFKPDIALSNGFRFCQPLAVDPKTGVASITKEFLWNMLPVNSEAKQAKVTGKQVWEWLEKELQNAFAKDPSKRFGGCFVRYNGMEVNFTIRNEFGKRVNWVKVGGSPIDLEKEYSIVACEREGDPNDTLCRIEHVKEPNKTPFLLHDVIIEYLKQHSPVAPKLEGRATATDEPATLLTQLKGTSYEFR